MTIAWDVLLRGGEVIDPANGLRGPADVAMAGGRIAAVGPALAGEAREVVDVAGRLVTPGLVDLHTHVFAGGSFWGIEPEPLAFRSGVTTWVDAGSAGGWNLGSLLEKIKHFRVRVPVLLNISGVGLVAPTGEALNLAYCDTDLALATVSAHRESIAGLKVRMDRFASGSVEPLRRAQEVGRAFDLPVMVHIGSAPPELDEVLELLRPGDIITHCASGHAAGDQLVHPALVEAHRRGIHLDVGHGGGSFVFEVMEAQLAAGIVPHSISTDLHTQCVSGPVYDLPTTLTKLLACGLSLDQVIAAATVTPARALGLGSGTLTVGAPADVAVFALEEGRFELADVVGAQRISPVRLRCDATYLDGARFGQG